LVTGSMNSIAIASMAKITCGKGATGGFAGSGFTTKAAVPVAVTVAVAFAPTVPGVVIVHVAIGEALEQANATVPVNPPRPFTPMGIVAGAAAVTVADDGTVSVKSQAVPLNGTVEVLPPV
jgi:hypothetical protein